MKQESPVIIFDLTGECQYLHNRLELDAYLLHLRREKEVAYQKARQNPPPLVQRMIDIKAERQKQQLQFSSRSKSDRGL